MLISCFNRRSLFSLILLSGFSVAVDSPIRAQQDELDVVIRGVEVYDGTGQPSVLADLGIRGEKLVQIGKIESRGKREIDGKGLVASPGFIDLHNHSDNPITREATRLNRNYLTQGVTTIVTGNCGGGREDVADYLAEIDKHGAGTNVAHLMPQGSLRRKVVGRENRPPSPQELERMRDRVAAGMQAGAFGISTGLIYVPSKYAATDELVTLAEVVGSHGGVYVSHMRGEGTNLLESVNEALGIGKRASLPVHISHFKASGRAAWGLAREAIQLIEEARADGQAVTADQYPYIASSTSLGAMVVPDKYRSRKQLMAALADPDAQEDLRKRIGKSVEGRSGGKSLIVASYSANRAWQGKSLADIAQAEMLDLVDLVIEMQKAGGASMVNFGMSEEEVRLIMQQPFVATASDGSARIPDETVPHPRSYGTFPRKLGYYAREGKVLSLAQAIRSSSGLPADILGLTDRGYLRKGMVADLVLFDPAGLRDLATFQEPHQYSTGVRYLFVNGELAIDEGEVTGKLPGRALRHASN